MNHLDINQIKEIIPHRHPFLLLDYIEDYVPGEYAVGYKCVSYREEFFAGHFPEEPVMPGVLTVEALAQAGAVAILSLEENKGKSAQELSTISHEDKAWQAANRRAKDDPRDNYMSLVNIARAGGANEKILEHIRQSQAFEAFCKE